MIGSRREFIGALAGALVSPHALRLTPPRGPQRFRIRTITAGVRLTSPTDLEPIESAIAFLDRTRRAFQGAGYEVQTTRIATAPLAPPAGRWTDRLLADLQALDRVVAAHQVLLSVGPLVADDRFDTGFPMWAATLLGTTRNLSCSVTVATPGRGIHHEAARTAAATIAAIARATPGAEGTFRFAAVAYCPLGIPFFPVAYHDGADAFAVGLEGIEALTHTPFGGASTLAACATVTDVLKSLAVQTCGYSGLMLPVLEDPVLARRAAEHRYGVSELLLYSSVCGDGARRSPASG